MVTTGKHIGFALFMGIIWSCATQAQPMRKPLKSCFQLPDHARARDIGVAPGILPTGALNAITDVDGVRVGQVTLDRGSSVHTGATAILPHSGNLFSEKVPAGVFVANGFGKSAGIPQIQELGEIETPIVLTNTLSVAQGIEAVDDWTLRQSGNEDVRSVNAVVGETNDGLLNDIRARALTSSQIESAIEGAKGGVVEEGAVGAGRGTVAFGWKGGIGTSSRVLPKSLGGYTVGVLVQSNFGGVLSIDGVRVGERLDNFYLKNLVQKNPGTLGTDATANGSIMLVIATDAPLSDRNLQRIARRAVFGVARTGSSFANGSGDFAIAFSTALGVRRTNARREGVSFYQDLSNDAISPLFEAAIEATEEAIYNSILMATTTTYTDPKSGKQVTFEAISLRTVGALLGRCR